MQLGCCLPAAVTIADQELRSRNPITPALHPLPDQGGLSHCQRRLGWTAVLLLWSYYASEPPVAITPLLSSGSE